MAVVPLKLQKFEEKVLAALKTKELSSTQRNAINAAHGIYLLELGKAKDRVADLRVDVEKKNTAIAQEQTRTVMAGFINSENIKKLGEFWIKPISSWGTPVLLEKNSNDEDIIDVNSLNDDEKTSEKKKAVVVDQTHSKEVIDDAIKSSPWFLKYPAILLAKVFGEMTPLAAAIISISVISGSIAYGAYARTTWKGNYDSEKETSAQLLKKLEKSESEYKDLLPYKNDYQNLSLDKKSLETSLEASEGRVGELTKDLRELRESSKDELKQREKDFSEQLFTFKTDANSGFLKREEEQLKRIGSLENEANSLKSQLTSTQTNLEREIASRDSQSTTEQSLRAQIEEKNDEIQRLINSESQAGNKLTEATILLSRLRNILLSVNNHFWSKKGSLEVRRACFRKHYTETLNDKYVLAKEYGIPNDMPSNSYSLNRDPNDRLEYCERYY